MSNPASEPTTFVTHLLHSVAVLSFILTVAHWFIRRLDRRIDNFDTTVATDLQSLVKEISNIRTSIEALKRLPTNRISQEGLQLSNDLAEKMPALDENFSNSESNLKLWQSRFILPEDWAKFSEWQAHRDNILEASNEVNVLAQRQPEMQDGEFKGQCSSCLTRLKAAEAYFSTLPLRAEKLSIWQYHPWLKFTRKSQK